MKFIKRKKTRNLSPTTFVKLNKSNYRTKSQNYLSVVVVVIDSIFLLQ